MKEIRIYIEGGGDSRDAKAQLRQGMDVLLRGPKDAARSKRLSWNLIFCGGRQQAFEMFSQAVRQADRETLVALLVDSEDPIAVQTGDAARDARARTAHLARRDGWSFAGVAAECVHLMVQCMEAWIVADHDVLAEYYGKGFLPGRLPNRVNLKEEPKQQVLSGLEQATSGTQKGRYGKIKHAAALLQKVDPAKVKQRCPRFDTFTAWLSDAIAQA